MSHTYVNCMYVLALSILGMMLLTPSFGMIHRDTHDGMGGAAASTSCSFMPGMQTLCQMSPLEHVSVWQKMFTGNPVSSWVLSILLLIAGVALVWLVRICFSPPRVLVQQELYFNERKRHSVISHIVYAFSQGILNPKTF